MTLTKKVAANTGFQIFGRVIQLAISGATIILLTRYLGPTDYGFYALILAFVGLFSDISGLGLNLVIARQMPVEPEKEAEIFANALSLKIFSSLIIFGLAVLAGILIYPDTRLHWGLILAAVSSFFLASQSIYQPIFQIKLKIYNFVIADIVSRLVGFGFLIFFISRGSGLNLVIATLVISSFLNWLMTTLFVRQIFPIKWEVDLKSWKALVKEALPLAGFVILSGISLKIGIVILSKLDSVEAVGILQVVLQPIIVLTGIPLILMGFIYPLFARYLNKDRERLLAILEMVSSFLILAGLSITGFLLATNQQVVSVLGGKSFLVAAGPLKILAIALALRMILLPFQTLAIANHQERKILAVYLSGLLLVVGLNFLLIPSYSYLGSAWSILILESFLLIAILILTKKFIREIALLKIFSRSLFVAISLSLGLWLTIKIPYLSMEKFADYNIWGRILLLIVLSLLFFAPIFFGFRKKVTELLK